MSDFADPWNPVPKSCWCISSDSDTSHSLLPPALISLQTYARIMSKRPAEHDDANALKRTRSLTSSRSEPEKTPNVTKSPHPQPPRVRKSLPIAPSLDSSTKSSDALSSAAIRRRMNPESLAGRLGPDLVKELESLLKPGITEMPSFSVRQEIQKRHGIDRRHIYDWFHNKGLRVTTSEKREERRALKAKNNIHVPTTRTMVSYRFRKCGETVCSPSFQEKNKAQTAAERVPSASARAGGRAGSSDSNSSTPRFSASSLSVFTGNHLPYEAACSMQQNLGLAISPMLDDEDLIFALPTVDSTTNAFSHPPSLLPGDPDRPHTADTHSKAYNDRTSHWIAEQQKIPYSPVVGNLSPVPASGAGERENLDPILPLENNQVLPQQQREAVYRSLSEVLPPARGIEECVGTYKAYMSQQGQKYFDRLVSGSYPPGSRYPVAPYSPAVHPLASPSVSSLPVSASPSLVGQRVPAPAEGLGPNEDFSKWLLYRNRSLPPSIAPSPSQTPSLSETATTASSSALWSHHGAGEHAREPSAVSCIDIAEILESPVLRSRNPTRADVASSPHVLSRCPRIADGPAFPADPLRVLPAFPYSPPAAVGYDYRLEQQNFHTFSVMHGAAAPSITVPLTSHAAFNSKSSKAPGDRQVVAEDFDARCKGKARMREMSEEEVEQHGL